MEEKTMLEKDMEQLAKYIQELSVFHGGIYISAACCEGISNPGIVTYKKDKKDSTLENACYFPKEA